MRRSPFSWPGRPLFLIKKRFRKGFLSCAGDRLLVKKTNSNLKYNMEEALPYQGAKMMYLVDEVDNSEILKDIVLDTINGLKNS